MYILITHTCVHILLSLSGVSLVQHGGRSIIRRDFMRTLSGFVCLFVLETLKFYKNFHGLLFQIFWD